MSLPLTVVSQTTPEPADRAIVGFLARQPLFEGVDRRVVADLAARVQVHRMERGVSLWAQGEVSDAIVFVRSGVVMLSRSILSHDVTLDYVGRGEILGVSASARASDAVMHEDGTLLCVPRRAFEDWLVAHPTMAPRVMDRAASRGRRLAERLALVSMHGAKARLSLLLLDFAERFGVRDSRGVIVDVRLTHRELASLIGATRETVSVAIVELRNASLIATESRRVVVLDPTGLRAVAAG